MRIRKEVWTRKGQKIEVVTAREDNGQLITVHRLQPGESIERYRQQFVQAKTFREGVRVQYFSSQANYKEVIKTTKSMLSPQLQPVIRRESKSRVIQYVFEAMTRQGNRIAARSKAIQVYSPRSLQQARQEALRNFYEVISGELQNQPYDEHVGKRFLNQIVNPSTIREGVVEYVAI